MAGHIESKLTRDVRKGRRPTAEKQAEMTWREAQAQLYAGITIADMTVIFRLDRKTVQARLAGEVKPCGKRSGADIFQIRDVAPYLVKPAGNIEEYISRMRPQDLPPHLNKEYWNGQRAKQKFMEDEGDLWRTDKVVQALAEVFQTLRMNLLLLPDAIDRRTSLSELQRQELRTLIDGMLNEMREGLIAKFSGDDSAEPGSGTEETISGAEHESFSFSHDAEDYDDEDDDTFAVSDEDDEL